VHTMHAERMKKCLHEGLLGLVHSRPADPIAFLAQLMQSEMELQTQAHGEIPPEGRRCARGKFLHLLPPRKGRRWRPPRNLLHSLKTDDAEDGIQARQARLPQYLPPLKHHQRGGWSSNGPPTPSAERAGAGTTRAAQTAREPCRQPARQPSQEVPPRTACALATEAPLLPLDDTQKAALRKAISNAEVQWCSEGAQTER